MHTNPLLAGLFVALALSSLSSAQDAPQVGAQGLFRDPLGIATSPAGAWRLQVTTRAGDLTQVESDLLLTSTSGERRGFEGVVGTGFLVSEQGQVIVTEATHAASVPVRLTVLDRSGRRLHSSRVPGLSDPQLSADGDQLGLRTRAGMALLDLRTFEVARYPRLGAFAIDADGSLAGVLPGSDEVVIFNSSGSELRAQLPASARRLAFAPDGGDLWVISAHTLFHVQPRTGVVSPRFSAPDDSELRDLRVDGESIHLGLRRVVGERFLGRHLQLDLRGRYVTSGDAAAIVAPPAAPIAPSRPGTIPWPIAPNAQHPIGNTYAEYQRYSGSPYMHPGIDVFGSDGQPVYAVAGGVIKAVLTTSGQYHWRVATGDAGAGTSTGYLYAHLDQPTIVVNVGDVITKGQYLGDLVPWPVSGFTHTHFARIEDNGAQWFGSWLCTDNPHLDLEGVGEASAPQFENAVGGDLFAFCFNETSNYQSPGNLKGKVDIVVHVGDFVDAAWECSVQSLRYTIYPQGNPGAPLVDNKLAVNFDMELDTYQNGPFDPFLVDLLYKEDSTCDTDGDYGSREFFHVITNSNGDEVYDNADMQEAWDTLQIGNGVYVIEVTARDIAGNQTTASMSVTVNN